MQSGSKRIAGKMMQGVREDSPENHGKPGAPTAARKNSHVEVCATGKVGSDRLTTGLERWRLEHAGLPELEFNKVETGCEVFGKRIAGPLFVAPMTGGTPETAGIVRNLALAAEEMKLPISVGSQRAAIEDPDRKKFFEVRRYAPTVPVFGNLGAVQLNYGYGVHEYRAAVEMIEADALFLHVNTLQECIQEGGDTDFRGLLNKLEELVVKLPVPVVVSEVGCGFSETTLKRLRDVGVRAVCPSGGGGTSWALVEALRARSPSRARSGRLFRDWGIPLAEAVQLARRQDEDWTVMAVGGVKDGLAMAKLVALGADLCGMARALLPAAMESADAVLAEMRQHLIDLRIAMFCAGAGSVEELRMGNFLRPVE